MPNAPISKEEALVALRRLQSGKSPGPDGLGSDVYKGFEELINRFPFSHV